MIAATGSYGTCATAALTPAPITAARLLPLVAADAPVVAAGAFRGAASGDAAALARRLGRAAAATAGAATTARGGYDSRSWLTGDRRFLDNRRLAGERFLARRAGRLGLLCRRSGARCRLLRSPGRRLDRRLPLGCRRLPPGCRGCSCGLGLAAGVAIGFGGRAPTGASAMARSARRASAAECASREAA